MITVVFSHQDGQRSARWPERNNNRSLESVRCSRYISKLYILVPKKKQTVLRPCGPLRTVSGGWVMLVQALGSLTMMILRRDGHSEAPPTVQDSNRFKWLPRAKQLATSIHFNYTFAVHRFFVYVQSCQMLPISDLDLRSRYNAVNGGRMLVDNINRAATTTLKHHFQTTQCL